MNATVKVINNGGTKYISIGSDLNPEREGKGPRPLFTQTKDNLTYSQADRELDPFNILGTEDYMYLVVSLEPEEFQRLGTNDSERLSEFVGIVREVMPEVGRELKVSEMSWAGGAHLNTDNPHFHLLWPKELRDRTTGALRKIERLPKDMLPRTEKLSDGSERVVGGRISDLFIAAIERRARPVKEIQIEDQAEGRVINRMVVEPRTLEGREPTPEEHLVGQWLSSEIQAACFTPDRINEQTPGRSFEDFVRIRGERERLRKEVRKLDAERAARGEDMVPAFISPSELISGLEGRPKTLTLSLRVKGPREGQSNAGELRLEQEEGRQSPESVKARVELERVTEISSTRIKEKEARNIISGKPRVPAGSLLHQETLMPASSEERASQNVTRATGQASSIERIVTKTSEKEAPALSPRTPELPFGHEDVVKGHHDAPASSLTKDSAQKNQLPLFVGVQGRLDFGPQLTIPVPAPEVTPITLSQEKQESIEPARPSGIQEQVAPEREPVARPIEISQQEQARAVETDHLSDEELSRYAGWASFYNHYLERARSREEQALRSKLTEQESARRKSGGRELEELRNRLDFLSAKGHEAFLVEECYDQACRKRGVKPAPFSPGQRDYLEGRIKGLDPQSAYLAERRFEIAKERLPAVEQFVDPNFLDFYRKAQERSHERSRSQEKRKEHDLQDKTEAHEHETKLVGTPERVDFSKSAIESAENSRLAQQVSTIEQVRELVAMML